MNKRLVRSIRVLTIAIASIVPWCGAAAEALSLRVLSSRPDAVSDGNALVELRAPTDSHWMAMLDGREVTALFRPSKAGEWVALITSLKLGKSVLSVQEAGTLRATIDLINHPLSGPIFSGPHQQPFVCQTVENGLGTASDKDCNARTIVQYYYKSTEPLEIDPFAPYPKPGSLAPGFKIYNPSGSPPSDVAQTMTSDGQTVPYIVRREVGTINRAVYDIQFLHQPGQPLPTPWIHPATGWNGRLVYLVDGGCGAGYRQGTLNVYFGAVGAAAGSFIAQGYATATSTLNVTGNDCSDYISAETLSMVKERFIKEYGAPLHTIGWGDSGGAYNQLLTVQNYPGLLDGIITNVSFPDPFTSAQSVADCALLDRAFAASTHPWSEAKKTAVSGFASWQTCRIGWGDGLGHYWAIFHPTKRCSPLLPKSALYDRSTNPKGVRCDLYGNEVNIFGINPRTGFAYRPLDNVGVQYGLAAFNRGEIDADEFIELNRQVGGIDEDGNLVAERTAADPESLAIAYEHGLVLTGEGGLSQVPIIDWRQYSDDAADNHDSFRSYVIRARLIAANGNAGNQIIVTFPRGAAADFMQKTPPFKTRMSYPEGAYDLVRGMDRWLDNIASDSSGTIATRVARNKPSGIADSCWATSGEHFVEPAEYGGHGRCAQIYSPHADPRIAAGGPLTDDVLKCALKPISAKDYSQPLSPEQLQRLRDIFPIGVCDYTKPAVGQARLKGVWQSY